MDEQRGDRDPQWAPVDAPRRQGRIDANIPRARGSPRSRRVLEQDAEAEPAVGRSRPDREGSAMIPRAFALGLVVILLVALSVAAFQVGGKILLSVVVAGVVFALFLWDRASDSN